ncbi:Transposable element Tcb2 transposase [Ceratobasidium sp. AG-Ba]|nr:Transposable element Tcb2 transposase [Ceratobasidium sp. AG-Ba]
MVWRWFAFSDESNFNIFGSDGKQYVWRRPRPSQYQKICQAWRRGYYGMGVITAAGVGCLYRIEGTFTGARYTEIFQDAYLGTPNDQRRRPQSIIFQQDNDLKHTSLVAREWFKSHRIEVTPWLASSPDLNIIEHVWEFLDRKVCSRDVLPRNKAELWEALKEEWYHIPLIFIEKLYDSIPSRLQAVIDAKGGNTRY